MPSCTSHAFFAERLTQAPLLIEHGTPGAAVVGFDFGVVFEVEEEDFVEVAGGGVLLDVLTGGVVVVGAAELVCSTLLAAAAGWMAALSVAGDEQAASTTAVARPPTAARIFFTIEPPFPFGSSLWLSKRAIDERVYGP
ncbi:hypothetical protein [Amycolatopsis taiwanensis]|uniref:Uncharacterized protein n=1 Tax=Amycolatopsis taiwanensis TaxID=342230 RepID=A0A9W6QWY3_9PSEU|nr:hypothetical protein Atai01_05920 [Amycolatopsis taiwanensis]